MRNGGAAVTPVVRTRFAWRSCYDDGWGELIVPEAFTHPAKFARGLVYRIVRHGLERGYWKTGDTILDPFA